VTHFNLFLFSILLSLLSPTTKNIERAFLQNDARILSHILSSESHINISLPEPLSFSDQLSRQQAYFLFQQIFQTYATFEFYSSTELPLIPEKQNFILKARWSFKNNKNNNQYVFQIFFYLMKEKAVAGSFSSPPSPQKTETLQNIWKITEIKAEKL